MNLMIRSPNMSACSDTGSRHKKEGRNSVGNVIVILSAMILLSCSREPDTLFVRLAPERSGLIFENTLQESPEVNILSYEYTYNGGGVAAADFNHDGLCDLYFTGNAVSNKLFLNKGELKFDDITDQAGVGGRTLWKTGVTAADVNADGWLDLYVCYSGPDAKQSLSNQLFINNANGRGNVPTFTERAAEYGIDAPGTYSTQASFFDYDRDGDLDMILINHANKFFSPFVNTRQLRSTRHPQFGNRLYRNNTIGSPADSSQIFTDVSEEAGIHGGGINFGLGVSVSDVNNDGWPDVYVSNDYEEQDFLYLNNGDGTFADITKKAFGHVSRNGMGTDIADFNNDGHTDLIEVDMWPEDNYRQKLLKGPDDYNRYMLLIDSGFHHQQMRNTLQVNAGIAPDGLPVFCEVGQLSGVSATDWSWAPLFADLDNDGLKDLFVTNGYLRDFTSMDFLKYTVEEAKKKAREEGTELKLYDLVSKMPSTKTSDYLFRNTGGLKFRNVTREWGVAEPNLSFGSAYADLDNDGDLELITNNTNEPACVLINRGEHLSANNYLRVKLSGSPSNPFGVGAKVTVQAESASQLQELFPARGYQSSVEPIIHFGLGKSNSASKVIVTWPDGKQSTREDVKANQIIEISYSTASHPNVAAPNQTKKMFTDISEAAMIGFVHRENRYIDFDHEPLIPYQLSRTGPALAKGDVNADGVDDFFVGGASGQSGALYLGDGLGHFKHAPSQPWNEDAIMEDTGATFLDVDSDGDLDLFVVSGGNEFPAGSPSLDDRLYINGGKGDFKKSPQGATVADHANGSCVAAADYDRDGDTDLFVGGRVEPGRFPHSAPGAILKNETDRTTGVVKFSVATNEVNADLRLAGMVTDATWADINNDSWPDLVVVGEWMKVRVFENRTGTLVEVATDSLKNSSGFWNRITASDLDKDGDIDFVLGNAGNNLPWQVSSSSPLVLYYGDFNDDGKIDPIIGHTVEGKVYPVASRDEILSQVSGWRKKFITYSTYANATIETILDAQSLNKAKQLLIQTTSSSLLRNLGQGRFSMEELPLETQISAAQGIIVDNFTGDDYPDILVSGNFYPFRTQYGPSDSSIGLLLAGNEQDAFGIMSSGTTGFYAAGDVRNMAILNGMDGRRFILICRNNDRMSIFETRGTEKPF